ncbi:MAG: hypothetical protein HQL75_05985 [Magnetococcales bacterium]|nr:hypothetical protein [Magnetococcales bacterium]
MPTLAELDDSEQLRYFAARVARAAMRVQREEIGLNHGFKTEQDILTRMDEGNAIDFDYDRLMTEVGKYA